MYTDEWRSFVKEKDGSDAEVDSTPKGSDA